MAAAAQSFTFGPAGAYTASWDGVSTLTVTLTSGGAFVASLAGQNLAQATASPEFQQLAAGALAPVVPAQLALQAATPLAGFALQNATPNILSWTAPADGAMHRAMLVSQMVVATAETGGQVSLSFTGPDGSVHARTVYAAGLGAGFQAPAAQLWPVQPGTAVTLAQATALTLGAATVWAELWAA